MFGLWSELEIQGISVCVVFACTKLVNLLQITVSEVCVQSNDK